MFGIEWLTGDLLNIAEGVLSLLVFASLWMKYREGGVKSIKHFSMYFIWFAAFQLIIGIKYVVGDIGHARVTGMMVMGMGAFFIALSYLPRAMANIFKPEHEMKIFGTMLGIGIAFTAYNIFNWTMLGPATALMTWGSTLLLAIPFAYLGWEKEGQRWKMWLVALGFVMKAAAGTIIAVGSADLSGLAEFLTFLGMGVIVVGLFRGEKLSS